MVNEEAAKAVATIPEEMESYAEISRLARSGQFARALESVRESPISQSTRQHPDFPWQSPPMLYCYSSNFQQSLQQGRDGKNLPITCISSTDFGLPQYVQVNRLFSHGLNRKANRAPFLPVHSHCSR